MRTHRQGKRAWIWSWKRWHVSLRVGDAVTGPLGIGFRLFYWRPTPIDWSCNVDILTPLFDLQFGFHRYNPRAT